LRTTASRFPAGRPAIVLPGGGGIQAGLFYPPGEDRPPAPVVINPRGLRAYLRTDVFFQAIPLVLACRPEVRFICPAMAGEAQAERYLADLGLAGQVTLLPAQPRAQMAELFRQAQVVVSPSTHDGTPNTLLEALACGCFPVVGDLESLREWILPGWNGLLVDPADPQALAEAILLALDRPDLRRRAAAYNASLVAARAEHRQVMAQAEQFYRDLANPSSSSPK
jgi:glycosyltransferase involved in cell wall biosynthesis